MFTDGDAIIDSTGLRYSIKFSANAVDDSTNNASKLLTLINSNPHLSTE